MEEKLDRLSYLSDISCSAALRQSELASKLEQLTGKSLDELVDLFAAGWTLSPPDPPKYDEMSKLAKEMDKKPKIHVCNMSDYILKD